MNNIRKSENDTEKYRNLGLIQFGLILHQSNSKLLVYCVLFFPLKSQKNGRKPIYGPSWNNIFYSIFWYVFLRIFIVSLVYNTQWPFLFVESPLKVCRWAYICLEREQNS